MFNRTLNNAPATSAGDGAMPAFKSLAAPAVVGAGALVAILLIVNQLVLAFGAAAGLIVALAVFWSMHLIVRIVTSAYLDAETVRRSLSASVKESVVRRSAMWRLVGYLVLDFLGLGLLMTLIYITVPKASLVPFMLSFVGAFAIAQIAIVSAASRSMRGGR